MFGALPYNAQVGLGDLAPAFPTSHNSALISFGMLAVARGCGTDLAVMWLQNRFFLWRLVAKL